MAQYENGSGGMSMQLRGTTVVAVHRNGRVAFAGDGQVSFGDHILKHNARKVRRMSDGRVLAGFAGSVADAFTLFERFEEKLDKYQANLQRAAMEFAREWRTDKYLRRLEAMLLVSDKENLLLLSGNGEVIEPDDKVAAIGSGGVMALAAARALMAHTDMPAEEIAREAISIAAKICVHTNDNISVEVLE
jgi:ATP-dependent HslUV protease, peptidase subunit HslV